MLARRSRSIQFWWCVLAARSLVAPLIDVVQDMFACFNRNRGEKAPCATQQAAFNLAINDYVKASRRVAIANHVS